MSETLADRTTPIALELHRLLRDLDPSRFRDELVASARKRIDEVADALHGLVSQSPAPKAEAADADPGLWACLCDLSRLLRERVPSSDPQSSEAWQSFRVQLGQAYETLSQSLRARSIEVPSLRPTNYKRSLFHVGMGIGAIVLVEHILGPTMRAVVPTAFALFFWFLEGLRRVSTRANRILMWIFRHVAHPREAHHVNSSTWFTTALALLGLFFPQAICTLAIAVLALADPAASLVGRRFGRTKLVHNRTLEGTATFAVVAFAAGFTGLLAYHGADFTVTRAALVAAWAALAAALTELFSRRLDDNFSVPMSAAGAGWIALQLL